MKAFFFMLVISFSFACQAQTTPYVRVFDIDGRKINSGRVMAVSDTLLRLKKFGVIHEISANNIGYIKTKRSLGHNIMIGSVIAAGISAIFYISGGNFYDETTSPVVILRSGINGGVVAGILHLFKNSTTFDVKGESQNLEKFQAYLMIAK